MPSFNVVNYSLRANKSIQRSLVFEGVRILQNHMGLDGLIYVGLSSVWFTDFHIAHKSLGIKDMISIESDPIGYERAKFNLPFKTARVERGLSYDVLPVLLNEARLAKRPWLIWLDYDGGMDEEKIEEMRLVIERAPQNSVFLITFNAAKGLGTPANRPERIRNLLGAVVPDNLSVDDCQDDRLPHTLLNLCTAYMMSAAAAAARPGGFLPAFRIHYHDTTDMLTVGGVLPARAAAGAARDAIDQPTWPGIAKRKVGIPPLTMKEATALQTELPRTRRLSRGTVRRLGFDLDDEHVECFETYYRYYPAYAQITA